MSEKNSNKNLIIAILIAAVIGIGGYSYYQSTQEPTLSIDVSEDGLDIDTN